MKDTISRMLEMELISKQTLNLLEIITYTNFLDEEWKDDVETFLKAVVNYTKDRFYAENSFIEREIDDTREERLENLKTIDELKEEIYDLNQKKKLLEDIVFKMQIEYKNRT